MVENKKTEEVKKPVKRVVKKGYFIKLDFVAPAEGKVFDTTIKEEAAKTDLDKDLEGKEKQFEPLSLCVSEGMVVKGLDKELENKEVGKEYTVNLKSAQAFGKRNPQLIKTVSLSSFEEIPQRGIFVNFNGLLARVINVSGGRVLVDLNPPLAGKDVTYKFKITEVIEENADKVKVLAKTFNLDIDVKKEDNKIKVKIKGKLEPAKILDKFKDKVKELIGDCEFD